MIRNFVGIFLFLWPALAFAEPVEVLSGEHVDFSRLVIQFGAEPAWELYRDVDAYVVVGPTDATFDLAGVFDKIPRTRIKEVSDLGDGRLSLIVADNVHADAFEIRAGRLVIDIKDGAPDDTSKFEGQITTKDTVQEERPAQKATIESFVPSSDVPPIKIDFSTLAPSVAPTMNIPIELPVELDVQAGKASSGDQKPMLDQLNVQQEERILDTRNELLGQMSRAVSQGLLTVETDIPGPVVPQLIEADPKPAPVETAPSEERLPHDPEDHVLVETSVDRDAPHVRGPVVTEEDGTRCIPDSALDLENWGDLADPAITLGTFRSNVVGEFDTPDPMAVERLAKYYTYLTFGAEAKTVLKQFGVFTPDQNIVLSIADIMDQGFAQSTSPFIGQEVCDSNAAFWGAMAAEKFRPKQVMNTKQILSTLSQMPIHVRRHLGPTLAKRFLDAGDSKTSKSIRNSIARAPGEHGETFNLLDAQIQLSDGKSDDANSSLDTLIADDGTTSVEALILRIETAYEANDIVRESLVTLAEAEMAEHLGTPAEQELRIAALKGHLLLDHFDAVFKSANEVEDTRTREALMNDLGIRVADTPDDLTFLKNAFALMQPERRAQLETGTRKSIAARLLDMGFVNETMAVLKGLETDSDPDMRILFANTALAQDRADIALGYIAGLDTDEAQVVRDAVLARLEPAPDTSAGVTEDLLPDTGVPSLAKAREMLETSAKLRSDLQGL